MWPIRESAAKSILTPTSGFIREAGFTHSLTPARNCTYGCTYCYVPTMGIYGGLRPEDVRHWGQFTTFKSNAADLLESRPNRNAVIYCSPLVDPYQPVEAEYRLMPRLLTALLNNPPRVFTIQTRAPLILRDLAQLLELSRATKLRISMSVTTDIEAVRQRYEPHCEPTTARLDAIERLREAGIEVYATLAPLLPCNPEDLADLAVSASGRDLIGDPLHVRATKRFGATTRSTALALGRRAGEEQWFNPGFHNEIVERISRRAAERGFRFVTGPRGFALLAEGRASASDASQSALN